MPIPIVCSWSTRFHGPGLEEMPEAVLAALGAADDAVRMPFDLDAPPIEALQAGLPALADTVEAHAGGLPIALVGECTLAPAVFAGIRRKYPGVAVIWIDAHGDLNTPETSPSGFLGGMPFAVALGWALPELAAAAGLGEPIAIERAVLVGARDLDPGEQEGIERTGLQSVEDVAAALAVLPSDVPLHVHLDTDVVDPEALPGMDFPAPDGWSVERMLDECSALAATGRIVGISVCGGNARRDDGGAAARAAADGIRALLGER